MARGAQAGIRIEMARVPLLPGVKALAAQGMVTGASDRNWAAYGPEVALGSNLSPVDQALLTDPQTSGGLLVSCAPESVADVLAIFRRHGFAEAAEVGQIETAAAGARLSVV
jgi:selenide,water dikinase